ncbi:MAG: hypothetical protein GXP62_08525 [Oligoflexia bacterium]|nr:hypothetical protein [Oligoflexia bacterium]
MTPRYDRAAQKLDYIVRDARLLGVRPAESQDPLVAEIAVWTRAPSGAGCGYYACFRLFLDDQERPVYTCLFCFYDGTGASPCIKAFESAAAFAATNGFMGERDA